MRDFNEIVVHNPEPYRSIYEFISTRIIPKYPCLTYCYQSNFDEYGCPRIQYYIRYSADLSISQEDKLFLKIFADIMEFLDLWDISFDDLDVDFILTMDGDFFEKQRE